MQPPPAPVLQRRLVQSREHRTKWAWMAPAGLAALGLGASLIGEATLKKGRGEPFVAYGTLALCVFNAGLCLFGEAVKNGMMTETMRGAE